MIIAVTGLSGTLGRHFPNDIIGLKTRLESSADEMFSELTSHQKIDCLIHLAAMTLVSDCDNDPQKAYRLNVDGAIKWYEAAARAGIKHFIFISTSHVYGNPLTKKPLSTGHPVRPTNIYGKTKVEAEIKLAECAQKNPQTKLTIARLFSALSKQARPGLLYSNLHRRAQQKDFSPVPGLNYVRDFITAYEAVDKIIRLASWNEAPLIVHICSGHGRTVLDLATHVFSEYGLDATTVLTEAPPTPNDIPWIIGEPTEIPIG